MLKRMVVFAAAWLVLAAGVAHAAIPNTSDYLHRTTPMITGTVVSVNDQQIVVDTDQGNQVTLVMDSHTMLPTDLAPGMLMRAEFRVMENGQYYVNRITPIRDATSVRHPQTSWRDRGYNLDPARANTTLEIAQSSTIVPSRAADQPAMVAQPEPSDAVVASDRSVAEDKPETLPQTASSQSLIGLCGLLTLLGAGALMLARGRYRA